MLKQITVISGKGGTGKTTLVASFAALAENKVIADCDVDAPDLHLLLHPEIIKTEEFKGLKVAVMDKTLCTECGICEETCWQIQLLTLPLSPYQERKDVPEYYLSPNEENFILSAWVSRSMGSNSTSPQAAGRRTGNQRITLPRSMGNTPIPLHIL